MRRYLFFLLFLRVLPQPLIAQPPLPEKLVKIIVAPTNADWTYETNEPVTFDVRVLKNNVLMDNVTVRYEIGPEEMELTKSGNLTLKNGKGSISGGTMKVPGFLRCTITVEHLGKTYTEWTTAGFSPEKIQPTVTLPIGFDDFWKNAIEENRKLPFDTKMTLLPDRCTDKANVYHVSLQNWKSGARLYGILTMPKAKGKYPALLKVPGAGIRPYYGDVEMAENGIITFEIGVHGISVIMPQQNYDDLLAGWNNHYWNNNIHDKETYFFKRVYMGCIKANDFLTSLPEWDGKNLGVMGSSQGGALTLVTAGLDERVTCAAPNHPAMCDMTGYLENRAGGWPHYLKGKSKWELGSHAEIVETIQFYDAANFARNITVPVSFSFGYNDNVVPPTSIFAAYNIISSPKEAFIAQKSAHWVFPEQTAHQRNWIQQQLKND